METLGRSRERILLVEDEPPIRELCQQVLADEGFDVDVAENGKIAQRMMEGRLYALYLIDVKIGEVDGKELYHWLRKKQPEMASRVIFTTGDMMNDDILSFLQQSSRPVLPKPFMLEELIAIVKEVMESTSLPKIKQGL